MHSQQRHWPLLQDQHSRWPLLWLQICGHQILFGRTRPQQVGRAAAGLALSRSAAPATASDAAAPVTDLRNDRRPAV